MRAIAAHEATELQVVVAGAHLVGEEPTGSASGLIRRTISAW